MKQTLGHLRYLVRFLNEKYQGSYLQKMQEFSKTDYFFSMSKCKKEKLILSLQASHPFITVAPYEDQHATLASPFFLQLRKELDHAYLENVSLWNEDRIVAFYLLATNEYYQTNTRYLVMEMMTGCPNLFLLDENKKILLLYHAASLQQGRILLKGVPYEFPAKSASFHDDQKEIPFDPISLFENYQSEIINKRKKDRYANVLQVIQNHLKQLKRKEEKQQQDYQQAEKSEIYRLYGDLLFTYLDEISSQHTEITLDGYTIPLQSQFTMKENALQYYKRYQKSRNALEHLTKQIEVTRSEIEYFTILKEQWEHADDHDLADMEEELIENHYLKSSSHTKKKKKKAYEPYFVIYKGCKIGYGKNNLQNDYLSFHLARKNDYFLHVHQHPGSHVVIFDAFPSKEVLLYASELAIHLAHLEDGDVLYTPIHQIMKTEKKGLVRLRSYQTLHIASVRKNLF